VLHRLVSFKISLDSGNFEVPKFNRFFILKFSRRPVMSESKQNNKGDRSERGGTDNDNLLIIFDSFEIICNGQLQLTNTLAEILAKRAP